MTTNFTLSELKPIRRVTTHDVERAIIANYVSYPTFHIGHSKSPVDYCGGDEEHLLILEDFWDSTCTLSITFCDTSLSNLQRIAARLNVWLRLNDEEKRHARAV